MMKNTQQYLGSDKMQEWKEITGVVEGRVDNYKRLEGSTPISDKQSTPDRDNLEEKLMKREAMKNLQKHK